MIYGVQVAVGVNVIEGVTVKVGVITGVSEIGTGVSVSVAVGSTATSGISRVGVAGWQAATSRINTSKTDPLRASV